MDIFDTATNFDDVLAIAGFGVCLALTVGMEARKAADAFKGVPFPALLFRD